MQKRTKIGIAVLALAALSTVALGQSFTTFVNARVTTQLDLQGTVTANGATGTAGQALTSNGAGDVTWATVGGLPGGANTQVQYNDSGALGGDAGLTYVAGTDTLTVGSIVGNGSGLTSLDAGDISAGTLAVARGGIGVGTLTGIAKGNGTSAFTAAASSDVIGLWTGTCNSTTFLRADGSCQTPGSGSVSSITAGTGLSASPSNPITTTGTLTVDQSFAPTWTGAHIFSNTSEAVRLSSTDPIFVINDTDSAVDNRKWWMRAINDSLIGYVVNDATNAFGAWLTVDRTGVTIDNIAFSATGVSASTAFNPDADLGATLGTSALRFSEAHTVKLCEAGCATTETIGSSGTTVILGAGSTWTDVSIPNVTEVSGSATPRIVINDTSGGTTSDIRFVDNGTLVGLVASANAAGQCVTGTSARDMCMRNDAGGAIRFSVDAGVSAPVAISSAGVLVASSATVGGSNVCRADGVNCPTTFADFVSGSYTGTVTGCTTSPTINVSYVVIANRSVTLTIPNFSCTSNANTMTVTGAPAAVIGTTASGWCTFQSFENAGAIINAPLSARMTTGGAIQFSIVSTTAYNTAGFNSGATAKGNPGIVSCSYYKL